MSGSGGSAFEPFTMFRSQVGGAVGTWLIVSLAGVGVLWFILGRGTARRGAGWATSELAVAVAGPAPATVLPAPLLSNVDRHAQRLGRGQTRAVLRFDHPPGKGVDRRVVGYRLVRISDGPDDLHTAEVGRLDRGDEVELLEATDGFARIRTPEGLEGWVPALTVLHRPGGDQAAANG